MLVKKQPSNNLVFCNITKYFVYIYTFQKEALEGIKVESEVKALNKLKCF